MLEDILLASASHAQPLMNPVALAVDDLREQYLREMALVRQTCERTGDGTAAIRRRSAVVDRILIEMWRRAFSRDTLPKTLPCLPSADTDARISSPIPISMSCLLLAMNAPKSSPERPFGPSSRECGISACAPAPVPAPSKKRGALIRTTSNSPSPPLTAASLPANFRFTSNSIRSPSRVWC